MFNLYKIIFVLFLDFNFSILLMYTNKKYFLKYNYFFSEFANIKQQIKMSKRQFRPACHNKSTSYYIYQSGKISILCLLMSNITSFLNHSKCLISNKFLWIAVHCERDAKQKQNKEKDLLR